MQQLRYYEYLSTINIFNINLLIDCLFRHYNLITARIRRMTGGYIFSLSTLAGGGGYPIPGPGRGYPIPGPGRGVPHPRSG